LVASSTIRSRGECVINRVIQVLLRSRSLRKSHIAAALATWLVLGSGVGTVDAQFTTIINSPPTIIGSGATIGSDTQLNVLLNGSVGFDLSAGFADGSGTNIEVNVFDGQIFSGFKAYGGTVVDVSGGKVHSQFTAFSGSEVNVSGGSIGDHFIAESGSEVNVSGGRIADGFVKENTAALTIVGNEFRLDGVLVSGLENIGNTQIVNLSNASVLSGTLADGTPFAFTDQYDYDSQEDIAGSITLQAAALPAIGPPVIVVSTNAALAGLRTGQTLTVNAGGSIGADFQAGRGASVVLDGGSIGPNLEAAGATVEILAGSVDAQFDAFHDSVVNVHGGSVGRQFDAASGSTVNISGGSVDDDFLAWSGSHVTLSGGVMGDHFLSASGSAVTISGGEFRLDGVLIAGLESIGNSVAFNMPFHSTFSGTLADGTPFAFNNRFDTDIFADGTITLEAAALPAIGPEIIHVISDVAPLGIRGGQTLMVGSGGVVADRFSAGRGSTVVVAGGEIGENFEAVASQVTISGGAIDDGFDAMRDSVVNITGGAIGNDFDVGEGSVVNLSGGSVGIGMSAFTGSTVNISGGTVDQLFLANPGSRVNISGGQIGDNSKFFSDQVNVSGGQIGNRLQVHDGGILDVSGGQLGNDGIAFGNSLVNIAGGQFGTNFRAWDGSRVNISGGTVGDKFVANGGSTVRLFGTQFVLDGVDITSSLTANVPLTILVRNVPLTGLLADGSSFDFQLSTTANSGFDTFSATATLTVTLIDFQPGDFNRDGEVDAADYTLWRNTMGRTVFVGAGADGNFDGRVTQGDYEVWKRHFGQSAGSGSLSDSSAPAVPEPTGVLMAVLATTAVMLTSLRAGRTR
jgi:hypothetical protein